MYQPTGYYPNNNYSQSQNRNMMSMQPTLKGRPVSSIEEVRAISVDFDGSMFYFPDLANRRIYTKQINMDGTASLNVYELREIPLEKPTGDYVTRQEFQEVIKQLQASFTPAPVPQQAPPQEKKEKFEF